MRSRAFVLVSTEHGTMIVNRNDWNKVPEGFYGVGYQLLNNGVYERSEVDLIKTILSERRKQVGDGIVALDCGANIGVHTIEMAGHMTGWGEVFAFEAQSRLYYALCGNIALNNVENVTAYWVALGNEVGYIDIPVLDYNKPASFGSLELRQRPKTEFIGQSVSYMPKACMPVAMSRISNYNWQRIDFIKLDVEGMELDVLEGAAEAIRRFRPHMLIEWIKVDRTKLEAMLTGFDYDLIEYGMNLLATPKV
jgi:FkbM family methyltransferase